MGIYRIWCNKLLAVVVLKEPIKPMLNEMDIFIYIMHFSQVSNIEGFNFRSFYQ